MCVCVSVCAVCVCVCLCVLCVLSMHVCILMSDAQALLFGCEDASHLFLPLGLLHPLLVQLTGIVLLIMQPQLAGEVGLYPPAVCEGRQSKGCPPDSQTLFLSVVHNRHSLPGKSDSTFITAVLGVGTRCVLAAWSMALYRHTTLLLIAPVAAPTTT